MKEDYADRSWIKKYESKSLKRNRIIKKVIITILICIGMIILSWKGF